MCVVVFVGHIIVILCHRSRNIIGAPYSARVVREVSSCRHG
uniref:Uncharacterized protein n=1 Tax=Anopheles albimanus TaxID=7167 RepID=A0A182FWW7_ANOAL